MRQFARGIFLAAFAAEESNDRRIVGRAKVAERLPPLGGVAGGMAHKRPARRVEAHELFLRHVLFRKLLKKDFP